MITTIFRYLISLSDTRNSRVFRYIFALLYPAITAVTQLTSRTTGVSVTTLAGNITTSTASLLAETSANFTVTANDVELGDIPVLAIRSGSNGGNTIVSVDTVAAGSFVIKVLNQNASAGASETGAIIINFAIHKARV